MSGNSSLPELTPLVKHSFTNAQQRSINENKTEISTAYFLSEILAQGQLDSIISSIGANPKSIAKKCKKLEKEVPTLSRRDAEFHNVTASNYLLGAFSKMRGIMNKMGDTKATLHTALAALSDTGDNVSSMLISEGINANNVIKATKQSQSQENNQEIEEDIEYPALLKYGEDLTLKAEQGKIDPVIGRDIETRRVMQILSRRTKNNPVIVGEPGTGKPVIDSTLVPVYSSTDFLHDKDSEGTPYKKVSDLKKGDYIFDRKGKPTKILGVYPQGELEVYRIYFENGYHTDCGEGHLWTYIDTTKNSEWKTNTLKEIIDNGIYEEDNKTPKLAIPSHEAIQWKEKIQSIPPRTLGIFLANNFLLLGEKNSTQKNDRKFFIKDNSQESFIPEEYKYGSIKQRIELIRGLFDANGTIVDNNTITLTSNSKKLLEDVKEVLCSLSYNSIIQDSLDNENFVLQVKVNTNEIKNFFSFDIQKDKIIQGFEENNTIRNGQNTILKIEKLDHKESMTCIYVDNDEHLFQLKDGIVTHNTTIVEGLARKIVANDCPEQLRDKKIFSLDISALSAGAKYQGEFEDRVKNVLKDIKKSEGKVITFIDEIHMISGSSGDPVNLSNMLKPMLARGEMHLIGATTISEYRQFIEKDPALERRFQIVTADEPSVRDTIGILRGIKEKYELHHGVRIQDPALVACAELAKRYINGRFLPDKAIDLMDESASRLKMNIDSTPESIESLEQEIRNLQVEKIALKKEDDERSQRRLQEVDDEITEKKEQLSIEKTDWSNSREKLETIRNLKKRKEELQQESDKLEREGDLDKVFHIRYEELPEIEQHIKDLEKETGESSLNTAMLSEEVTADIVADVVSSWTGISASRMSQSETDKILNLAEHLDKRVIGQKDATIALAKAIKRSRAGVSDPNRPIGSFLFSGPSGTGKSEVAKALAEFLFDDEKAIVKFSMEEYSDQASINKLIGAPAGYVGFDDMPGLERVRQKPSSVVLFDELEKAHDRVIITLLSVLEEGHITLNNGKEVDFTNTVIIFTSNLGAATAEEVNNISKEDAKNKIMRAIERRLPPEFINRLDGVIAFNFLTVEDLEKIVDIQIKRLEKTLESKSITLTTTPQARKLIAEKGYNPAYGARPVRRIVSGEIADILADDIIRGIIPEESNALIDAIDNDIDIRLNDGSAENHTEQQSEQEPEDLIVNDMANDQETEDDENDELEIKDMLDQISEEENEKEKKKEEDLFDIDKLFE